MQHKAKTLKKLTNSLYINTQKQTSLTS